MYKMLTKEVAKYKFAQYFNIQGKQKNFAVWNQNFENAFLSEIKRKRWKNDAILLVKQGIISWATIIQSITHHAL